MSTCTGQPRLDGTYAPQADGPKTCLNVADDPATDNAHKSAALGLIQGMCKVPRPHEQRIASPPSERARGGLPGDSPFQARRQAAPSAAASCDVHECRSRPKKMRRP